MRIARTTALVACLWLLAAGLATAQDLYVNAATGNDGNAGTGSGTAWATLCRATNGVANNCAAGSTNAGAAADAGDVVHVAAGVYAAVGSNDRFRPAFNPANSGSSGNIIEFRCEAVAPDYCIGDTHTNGGPTFGSTQRDYISWTGRWKVSETGTNASPATPDTGAVVINGAVFVTIDGMTVVGPGTTTRGDNYPGVRFEEVTDSTIRNMDVSGYQGEGGTNGPCVQMYRAGRITVEHNNLYDCDGGVTLKGTAESTWNDTIYIRYNLMWGHTNSGVEVHRSGAPPHIYVYQNVIVDSAECITLKQWDADTTTGPRNVRYVNNTCVNPSNGAVKIKGNGAAITQDNDFLNNITYSGDGVFNEDAEPSSLCDISDYFWDRNLYGPGWNLAAWQADCTSQDDNSVSDDPDFVSPGTETGDYHLLPGSPALTLGRVVFSIGGTNGDTIPVGAYITGSETIGTGAASGGETVPDAPTIGTATAGNTQCSVAFTPPGDDGGSTITGYTATSSPGSFTGTGGSSPIVVTGLSNGTGYTFTVIATNAEGNSSPSSASNTCTPAAAVTGPLRLRVRTG